MGGTIQRSFKRYETITVDGPSVETERTRPDPMQEPDIPDRNVPRGSEEPASGEASPDPGPGGGDKLGHAPFAHQ